MKIKILNQFDLQKFFIFPWVLLITTPVFSQNNLRDIPDPDPQQQLAGFQVAEGFEVSLFASDPMVVKPIQMNWDADGRLWVVSSTVYPHLKTGEEANDKIFILEDTDGDGKADKSTIFADGLLTPTGILPGDGGVYVANSTEILHLSDTDGDGKADKSRRVLSGFGTGDTHHLIHTFRWGPEGLLYFSQSIYIYSHVETPWGVKRLGGSGVWQLRPSTLELNVYAKGLVNPWGMQFNRWGQSFLTDGAGGEGINYAFPDATFVTAPGAERILRGLNPGQPKHSGLEVISGRHLPESWAGSFITNDFRANRINRFTVEEQGSGYATKQAEDLLWTDNVSFRPVDISVGPDGAIYVADWYNPIIQHGEVDFHDPRRDQEHGRIWRIVAKDQPLVTPPKLGTASVDELLESLKVPENWTRSQAKQMLKERGAMEVLPKIKTWLSNLDPKEEEYEHHRLEALWVHQSLQVENQTLLLELLKSGNHNVRAASVRVLSFWHPNIENAASLLQNAIADTHPRVRLEAVNALRNIKNKESALTSLSALDKSMDEFLDFALWQTLRELEPFWMNAFLEDQEFFGNSKKTVFALKSASSPEAIGPLVDLYQKGEVLEVYRPEVLETIAKKGEATDLGSLYSMALDNKLESEQRLAHLGVLEEAFRQRKIKPDADLHRLVEFLMEEDENIRLSAIRLMGYWDREEQTDRLVKMAQQGPEPVSKVALEALASMSSTKSQNWVAEMTGKNYSAGLRQLANSQLVSLDAAKAADITREWLQDLPSEMDASVLFSAFLSTKQGTGALAGALSDVHIQESLAKIGRQVMQQELPYYRNQDEEVILLKKILEASGGVLPPEKMPQQLTEPQITQLAQKIKTTADAVLGEAIFRRTNLMCQNCHALGGAGGLIGPDLSSLGTSSPIDNIIQSLLVPNESIKEGYELQKITKKDGAVVMGYLVSDGNSEVVIRNVAGMEESVPKSQIEQYENVPGSLMPPGLTSGLDKEEFINLVGYLSKLGESGNFRAPNSILVRRWRAMSGNEAWVSKIRKDGMDHLVDPNTKSTLLPLYSTVAGDLPIEEVPVVNLGSKGKFSFLQFEIEVLSQGYVNLMLPSTVGIQAWAGSTQLPLSSKGTKFELSPGIHQITLAIDRNIQKGRLFNIQLQEAENSPAQTRLVMGR